MRKTAMLAREGPSEAVRRQGRPKVAKSFGRPVERQPEGRNLIQLLEDLVAGETDGLEWYEVSDCGWNGEVHYRA